MELLKIAALLAVLVLPLFYLFKKRSGAVKIPKDTNDTSDAHYAINEDGILEEIHHDNLSNHQH
jgi:hypothetical protein